MKLRKYQAECANAVKRYDRNLIHLATGGGKSVIFKALIKREILNGNDVLFLVAGISILDQAIKKHFAGITDDITLNSPFGRVACYSIDTLSRRPQDWAVILNKFKYIVIDECHHCTADRYMNFLEQTGDEHTVVGLTATPYRVGKKGHKFWNNVIHPISVEQLIKEGHLVFPKCFTAEIQMNTKVKTTGGDFNNKALFEINDDMKVYGSIIDEYLAKGENQKAICFAINIEHSMRIAMEFNARGIKAVHADATTSIEERAVLLNQFENGDVQVLCNVNIFSTGIDTPIAAVGIMARPTKSRVLWIQQVGRMLRPHPLKKFATILDHGGNIQRIGHPLEDFDAQLEDKQPGEKEEPKIQLYTCNSCFYVFSAKTDNCPMCNATNEVKERKIKEEQDARLKEIQYKKNVAAVQSAEEKRNKQWENIKGWYFSEDLEAILNPSFKVAYTSPKHHRDCDPELTAIGEIIQRAFKFQNKPNSIFFKVYAKYPDTNYLKFPKWFLDLKDESL